MEAKGRVAGAKPKQDLVWLRRESGGEWRKVVVDVKITSTGIMNDSFKEKDEKYRVWATKETRESKVEKAVVVPIIISHDGAVHKESVKRWKDIAPDIAVDWVRMAQNVLRYNVVIVGKFFNKGSWVSEAWRKKHPEEFTDNAQGPPERIETASERKERLHISPVREGAVCVRPLGTPPPHGVRLTSAKWGNPSFRKMRTNQPT